MTTRISNKNYERETSNDELKSVRRSSFKLPHTERGAALVALLALMTIMALLMLAAAPNILMDVRRERELEAIRRGEEVQEAIWIYARTYNKLPKRMEDLLEGITIPGRTKKLMILRPSAAIDPLSSTGEWKLVARNDTKELVEFQRRVVNYTGSNAVSNPEPKGVFDPILRTILSSINVDTSEDTDPPGGEDTSPNIDNEFVGVRSRSQRKSVISYYGIERLDRWIFTPLLRGVNNPNKVDFPIPPPTSRG